jgi:hypothetical protein
MPLNKSESFFVCPIFCEKAENVVNPKKNKRKSDFNKWNFFINFYFFAYISILQLSASLLRLKCLFGESCSVSFN